MKNAVASSATVLLLLLLMQSCSKKSQDGFAPTSQSNQLITATVSAGQTYTFTAGSGELTVSRQALHFQVSETNIDERGLGVYIYSPKPGYQGLDEVMLTYSAAAPTQATGGCQSNATGSISIIIKFNVAN